MENEYIAQRVLPFNFQSIHRSRNRNGRMAEPEPGNGRMAEPEPFSKYFAQKLEAS